MKVSQSIARESRESNPYAFDRLRKEGIEISQEMSGSAWTDYNYHDPGVTILEQVCFALTDLIYRSSFDVADYLCDEDGDIDLEKLGLHAPEDVFFSRPCTPEDLEVSLVDMSDDADLVLVSNGADNQSKGGYGLYTVKIRMSDRDVDDDVTAEKVKAQVKDNYYRVRNLCEDLDDEIEVAVERECFLQADISIKPEYRAASVFAELYFEAAAVLASSVSYTSYSEKLEEGGSLDESFLGPFTKRGLLVGESLRHSAEKSSLTLLESKILSRAQSIPGIDYVAALKLRPVGGGSVAETPRDFRFRLKAPRAEADLQHTRVSVAGQVVYFSMDEFLAQLDTIRFARANADYSLQEDILLSVPHKGTYRKISSYQSLQNQFPDIYGINQYGVPRNYSDQRKAQALQLKSYLLLFEQIMSNYLANLDSINQTFSISDYEETTYYSGLLSAKEISNLEKIYPKQARIVLDEILERIDNFIGRKSRLLDYLLGLYGEEFLQQQLREVNCYLSEEALERKIITNKIRLLNRIKFASGERAGALNYSRYCSIRPVVDPGSGQQDHQLEAASGLQYRTSIFLGFEQLTSKSMTIEFLKLGLLLGSPGSVGSKLSGEKAAPSDSLDKIHSQEMIKAARNELFDDAGISNEEADQIAADKESLKRFAALDDADRWQTILSHGVKQSNYKYRAKRRELVLSIKEDGESTVLVLLRDVDKDAARQNAQDLRSRLIDLSKASEGMHVIEHILLRPENFNSMNHDIKQKFANRISVVFPVWTSRCQDLRFRDLAEQTVRKNCPAHIAVEFHWLDFPTMCEFEYLYESWLREKKSGSDHDVFYKASTNLALFLELQKFKQSRLNANGSDFLALKKDVIRSIDHYSIKLERRKHELEQSERRVNEEERAHLREFRKIDRLRNEIKKFDFSVIKHLELFSRRGSEHVDWGFHAGRTSVVLPRIKASRCSEGEVSYFHKIFDLVEKKIQEHNTCQESLAFHWLVPSDYRKFLKKYSEWNRHTGQNSSEMIEVLKLLEKHKSTTSDRHGWTKLLGGEQ